MSEDTRGLPEVAARWWRSAAFDGNGPYTPTGVGGNDGIVRDRHGYVVADCGGNEARADVLAAFLNFYFSSHPEGFP